MEPSWQMSVYIRTTWKAYEQRTLPKTSFPGELSWGPRIGISTKFVGAAACLRKTILGTRTPVLEQSIKSFRSKAFQDGA